jgi:iron(III) transport system permease protein
MADVPVARPAALRARLSRDDVFQGGGLGVLALFLFVVVLLPLYAMLSKSLEDADGNFIGFANYVEYFGTPALVTSAEHTITIGILITLIVVTLAFIYAYALTRSCMPFKGLFRGIAMIPILAPSLLPAISLVYLFGNQGMIKEVLGDHSIYGPIGIVIALSFWIFPHTVIILTTALSMADARLYEAAVALRASKLRTFFTVTLPAAKYGVMSACFVAFTYAITDFGAPKVIGGWYNVLSVDIYKQVVGQWNFQMGAVVSVVLLFPVVLTFIADRLVQRRQVAQISARSVPLEPKPNRRFDLIMLAYCLVVTFILVGMLGVSAYASLIKFWPYDLSFVLSNYQFDLMDGGGWDAYWNSIVLATTTAFFGTLIIFSGAYLVEKSQRYGQFRSVLQFLAILPLAVPGMVLGLAYIFFFNNPANPLSFLYQTMGILVICTIAHYYTVPHLTALTALKQMDPEFEAVSASRGGLGLAQGAVLQDLLAGHVPRLPAGHPGHLDLPLRQCHDDCVCGRVSLGPRNASCLGRGPQHGRPGGHRAGRGHGDDDLLHQCRRAHIVRRAYPRLAPPHPSLADKVRGAVAGLHFFKAG